MNPADLIAALRTVVAEAVAAGEFEVTVPETVHVERPRSKEHGDYASNVALTLAKQAGRQPRQIAEILAARLRTVEGIGAVDVAGPGFLNVTFTSLGGAITAIIEAGPEYGTNDAAAKQRINLEFVSANPTGPIHVGGTRWAAVGDALGRLLTASGAEVTREYYVNDAGAQIDRFAASQLAVAKGEPTPENGYAGGYIAEVAARVLWSHPGLPDEPLETALETFRLAGVEQMLESIRGSLDLFGVHFDVWFSERSLTASGAVVKALERLRAEGHTYEADGALWLRTTDFGDDKDRVLVKSDGDTSYFTSDAAYYLDKRERGFERCIYMLGADHHGYVGRLRAMVACFGDDPNETLEVLIGQLVNVMRGGEPVRMSKRAGTFITLDDLVELVGVDAARYSLARASVDSALDLDVDLLASQTNANPVFYVQYAHARLSSLLRGAHELGIALDPAADVTLLVHEREGDLLRGLGEFPRIVASAASGRAPHRVARYLEELAGTYHRFYDVCRVLPQGDEEAGPLTAARLLLVEATRIVIANGLALLGVSAPERM
jgi:arginyl-tRNA synthetase